jgi:tetratricopeptide (TPR) repeat protein
MHRLYKNMKLWPNRPGRAAFSLGLMLAISMLLAPATASSEPTTVDEWLDLGWDYYNLGNLDQAFNTFLQAVDLFPSSTEAHLALAETYFKMGQDDRGRDEILRCLQLDDQSPLASRAHYLYAYSIREQDPALALMHLDRAHLLGASASLQFDIADQMRFCRLLITMSGRAQSGLIVIHFSPVAFGQNDIDILARAIEDGFYLVERFCTFEITDPVHVFLYASPYALRVEIPEGYEWLPDYREFHIAWSPDTDYTRVAAAQVIRDLQENLNRHSGSSWIEFALPTAISGRVGEIDPETGESVTPAIDCDEAVRALVDSRRFIALRYLWSDEYSDSIPDGIFLAESSSFLKWVKESQEIRKLQEIITQPNIELVLSRSIDDIQTDWLRDITQTTSLISDPTLVSQWIADLPPTTISADPDLPLQVLRRGLGLYLNGERASGLREIHAALDMNPGFGLGYYTLGWISSREGNWDDAREQLTTAVMLLEDPKEIAWCHVLLAPIFLNEGRWSLAQASLQYVETWSDSPQSKTWAEGLLTRVDHIIELQPTESGRDSIEFAAMFDFMSLWNQAVNGGGDLKSFIGDTMDLSRSSELEDFYSSIRLDHPSVIFNHALQAATRDGTDTLIEIRIKAVFPGTDPHLPPLLEPLTDQGYLRFFRIAPGEDGWKIVDWEDGWFPLQPIQHFTSQELGVTDETLEIMEPTPGWNF